MLPRWVRLVDAMTLLMSVAGLVVAVGGGFRERFGGVRVAITSPWGLLAAALLLTLLRHAIERRDPAPLRWLRAIGRSRTAASNAAWYALLTTRPIILVVGFFATLTFGFDKEATPVRYSDNEAVNLQGRFDSAWYVDIATQGYQFAERPSSGGQSIVFFPAYPMAMRIVGRLLGGHVGAYLFAGTLISWGAFLLALVYVFRLARDLLGSETRARLAVLLLAAYPFAFFYGAVYTESLFLLGAAGAFVHLRSRQFVRAAAWGLLVGLTRPNGFLLAIPLSLVVLRPWIPAELDRKDAVADEGSHPDERSPVRALQGLIAAAAPVLGLVLYSAFVWRLTGNPLAWLEGQAAWGRTYTGLLPVLQKYYSYFSEDGAYVVAVVLPYDLLNAAGALFVLALAIPVWRRFGLAYVAFILVNILPPVAQGGFLSTGRFSAVLFPVFFWLASAIDEDDSAAWLINFMALQALGAALFYTGRRLF